MIPQRATGHLKRQMPPTTTKSIPTTLPFDRFWAWLQVHPNCILRAGTPEAVLFDDEDLHWHFGTEEGSLLVQLIRGKRIEGELMVQPTEVAYVQAQPGETDGEFLFELVSEAENVRLSAYFFVLSHGYDEEEPITPGRWTH